MEPDREPIDPEDHPQRWREFLELLFLRTGLFDKYGPTDWIDGGGYGRIGKIVDGHLRRGVCLKTPKLEGKLPQVTEKDEDTLSRFVFEAFITASLTHPGVPPIHEIGIDRAGLPYYTMKWIRGETLLDVLTESHEGKGGWTPARLARALVKVCDTMEYAHAKGVLHRDLSLRNVMLGRFGEVFVLDWGLAKVWNPDAFEKKTGVSSELFENVVDPPPSPEWDQGLSPHTGSKVFGTPFFIAPELLLVGSGQATPRTDVYSLGAILYFMLCGRLPYEPPVGKIPRSAYLEALKKGPPVPASKINPDAGELANVCDQALAHDPEDRFDSMAQLRTAILDAVARPRASVVALAIDWMREAFRSRDRLIPEDPPRGESPRADKEKAPDFFEDLDLLTMVEKDRLREEDREDTARAEGTRSLDEILMTLQERTLFYFDYEVIREIGRGGQGMILEAFDPRLRRKFAIETIAEGPDQGDDFSDAGDSPDSRVIGRLLAEAQITAQLDHPNIIPVHEVGVYPRGHLYFTMELVQGEDLRGILMKRDEDRNRSLLDLLEILVQVCEAVAYAHRKGVVHRDIKPGNIFVGSFGEVYVVDWGLAHVLSADTRASDEVAGHSSDILTDIGELEKSKQEDGLTTMDGDVVGTPVYMSPEQARGDLAALSDKTDVFALGATLFHLLTGRMPFVKEGMKMSSRAIWMARREGQTENVLEANPTVPKRIARICEWAMEHEPLIAPRPSRWRRSCDDSWTIRPEP